MADGFVFDADAVLELAADLEQAPQELMPRTREVVQRGAMNVKKDWQGRWRGLTNLPMLASSITYDVKASRDSVEAEIGADKSRPQGPLANVAEFGTRNNAPHPGGGPALVAEASKFEKALGEMLEKLMLR